MKDKLILDGPGAIYQITNIESDRFEEVTIDVFAYQYQQNDLYREYCDYLNKTPATVRKLDQIPFLPIEFFKTHTIKTGDWGSEEVFSSSGTTGPNVSKHHFKSLDSYRHVSENIFESMYGELSDYVILALLPSYLERKGSSLVEMVDRFIKKSNNKWSGFFLNEYDEIVDRYEKAREEGKNVILWGVSFALLDFADYVKVPMPDLRVIETGGMKGRRKELTREELHKTLQDGLQIKKIESEYGMTELMSQAYADQNGRFRAPKWMKVFCREINDPFSYQEFGQVGGINIIDLGNLHSCAFIATQDLGKRHENGTFEITGRLDNSDIRGCNLMIN